MAFGLIFSEQYIHLYFLIPIKAKHMVWGLVGITALYALAQPGSSISYSAHAGGLLAGLILIRGLWRPGRLLKESNALRLRYKAWALKREMRRRRIHIVDNDNDRFGGGTFH